MAVTRFSLAAVALHEVGHVLGLGHSEDPKDVMSPYYVASQTKLTENDVSRAAALYP